jgi:hypothetical protein
MHAAQDEETRGLTERVGNLPRLLRGTPEENLGRLVADDPLRLFSWSAAWLRERFLLVDAERVFVRALGQIAFDGAGASAGELDSPWVLARLDRTIHAILDEEREEERSMPFQCPPEDPRYGGLREMGVVGVFARTASIFFNSAPRGARRAFRHVCLDKRPIEECLGAGPWTLESLREDVWSAIRALGYHRRDGRPEACSELQQVKGVLVP